MDCAHAVQSTQDIKQTKYLSVRVLAERQLAERTRTTRPSVKGFVVSHSIEPSKDVHSTLDFLVEALCRHRDGAVRTDGSTMRSEVTEFRADFRRAIALATAAGFARTMRKAG